MSRVPIPREDYNLRKLPQRIQIDARYLPILHRRKRKPSPVAVIDRARMAAIPDPNAQNVVDRAIAGGDGLPPQQVPNGENRDGAPQVVVDAANNGQDVVNDGAGDGIVLEI